MEDQGLTESETRETAVARIARSQGLDAEEVKALYESILAEMRQKAIILDFLPIFAARKVKDLLVTRKSSVTA